MGRPPAKGACAVVGRGKPKGLNQKRGRWVTADATLDHLGYAKVVAGVAKHPANREGVVGITALKVGIGGPPCLPKEGLPDVAFAMPDACLHEVT